MRPSRVDGRPRRAAPSRTPRRPAAPLRTASHATGGGHRPRAPRPVSSPADRSPGRLHRLSSSGILCARRSVSGAVGLGRPSADGRHQGWVARRSRMATGVAISSPRAGSCPARASRARSVSLSLFSVSSRSTGGRTPRYLDGFAGELRRDVRQDVHAGPRGIGADLRDVRRTSAEDLRRHAPPRSARRGPYRSRARGGTCGCATSTRRRRAPRWAGYQT